MENDETRQWSCWLPLLGKLTTDADLAAALKAIGVSKLKKLHRDIPDAAVDHHGMTLNFVEAAWLFAGDKSKRGAFVLQGVALHVSEAASLANAAYTGDLPYGVRASMSQGAVRALLGAPRRKNKAERWDLWRIDGRDVTVIYVDSLASIESLSVYRDEP